MVVLTLRLGVVSFVVALLALLPALLHPRPVPARWQIVYTRPGPDVYIVNSNGGDRQPMRPFGEPVIDYACSNNGVHFAYTSYPPGDIRVVNVETNTRASVALRGLSIYDFSVSSDGTQLVASAHQNDEGDLELFSAQVTPGAHGERDWVKLTNDWGFDRYPTFTPDDRQIIFTSFLGKSPGVYALTRDGRALTNLTPDLPGNVIAVASPDAPLLGYGRFNGATGALYVADPTHRLLHEITTQAAFTLNWSPDGQHLLTLSSARALYIIDWTGANRRRVVGNADPAYAPCFLRQRPDINEP